MARYLLAFHGGTSTEEAWDDWLRVLGDHVVDPGSPVGAIRLVAGDGQVSGGGSGPSLSQGPPGPSPLSRYALIDVESIDEAITAARGSPALRSGAVIEVCETFSALP